MVRKSEVEMSFSPLERLHVNPGLFNHELFSLMVQKFMVEKSGVEKFIMEKSSVEVLKPGLEKSVIEISFNQLRLTCKKKTNHKENCIRMNQFSSKHF